MRYCKQFICFFSLVLVLACGNRPIRGSAASGSQHADTGFLLHVLSYNIHHANPPSRPGVIDLNAVAAVINQQQPHLVALQEVDVYTVRSGKTLHQAEALARMTGMTAFFAKAIDYDGGEYGVAILSKLPMEDMKNTPLPTVVATKGEPRTLATAVITLPGGKKVLFASTHLDAQRGDTNRLLQVDRIIDVVKKQKLPVIIAGDFNAVPDTRIIKKLDAHFTRTCVVNCGFTFPEKQPTKIIDFIAYTPSSFFTTTEHQVVNESYASDHLPVFSVIRIK